jgi:hypothetical protein
LTPAHITFNIVFNLGLGDLVRASMLSNEDNNLLTEVGPGTPMGDLMRQYWVPTLLSEELPGPDADPVRVLLLGERLVAFRSSEGQVGLLAEYCPH